MLRSDHGDSNRREMRRFARIPTDSEKSSGGYTSDGTMTDPAPSPTTPVPPRFSRALLILVVGLLAAAGGYFAWKSGEPGRQQAESMRAFLAGTEPATLTFFKLDPFSGHTPLEQRKGAYLQDWMIFQETTIRDPEDRKSVV